MGQVSDKFQNDEERYVGRNVELKKASDLLKTKKARVVGVFGMKMNGKSRFVNELLHNTHIDTEFVTYYDFELDDVNDLECQYEWLDLFYTHFGTEDDIAKFHKCFPDGKTQCGHCKNCNGHKHRCSELKNEINRAVKCLNKRKKETLLILDNIDKLVVDTEGIKDDFLDFIQLLSSKTSVQVIVTSTNTIKMQGRFEAILLDSIDEEASLDLLYECIEIGSDDSIKSGDGPSCKRCFDVKNKVFTPGNESCIKEVAKQCEGLPMALKITGGLLKEDNYLFSPADMLQLLILSRVQILSPENAPSSDRLDIHKKEIKQLNELYSNFYEHVNKKMTSDGCTIQEANTGTVSGAQMKQIFVRPLINKSLMSHRDKKLYVHGVLSECVPLAKAASVSADPNEVHQWLERCMKERAKLVELDIPDECFKDARQLEHFIQKHFPDACQERYGESGGRDLKPATEQQECSSTIGPCAMPYQRETSGQSYEKSERVAGREKEHGPVSTFRASDNTERLNTLHFSETNLSELGSIVCQPDN